MDVWALTDHDELGGQARAMSAAAAAGVDYLCGVEVSVSFAGETVHIVGLGVDAENGALRQGLAATRAGRLQRPGDEPGEAQVVAHAGDEGHLAGQVDGNHVQSCGLPGKSVCQG